MNYVLGITAVAPSAEPGILYTDDRLMAAGSKLSNRFDNLIYERMVTKISRPNPDESQGDPQSRFCTSVEFPVARRAGVDKAAGCGVRLIPAHLGYWP